MARSCGCSGDREELLIQENAQDDSIYKIRFPNTRLLSVIVVYNSKIKELQFLKSNKGTVVLYILYIPFTVLERH